jgi:hypothetical protein|tara:strand:- start:8521 stop:8874 length:354 start_codon:yes stop_codon:yes gene_type:complete
MNTFKGRVTDLELKKGNGKTGAWAVASFEVTEVDPKNTEYPEIARFEMFKNGEYLKYATGFGDDFPIGTLIEVEYQHKRSEYNKDGETKYFYKNTCWKVAKLQEEAVVTESEDDLPF